ncbi:Cleavage stimulation factor subunit 2 [Podila verticillata]|nr:Cleavage stimulation factor subunit 2 [Podila verticillata]
MSGSKIVFVGNIPYEQTEEQLIEIFSEVGPVVSFRLLFERETGKPRGYGFCEYQDERTAASAVRNLNGREIGNRSLKVDFADTDQARMDDGNFSRGGGPNNGHLPRGHGPMPPPPHMLGQMPPRMDPRLAGNAPPPPVPLIPPPSQPQAPVPVPGPPNPSDTIAAVLGTMTPQNMFDLISSMKVLGANEPDKARAVLNANPQLSYALFQALLMMNLVEPSSLQVSQRGRIVTECFRRCQDLEPRQGHPILNLNYHHLLNHSQDFQAWHHLLHPLPRFRLSQLVAQVLALTPEDIASLPQEQRANIIQLRAQLMGGKKK